MQKDNPDSSSLNSDKPDRDADKEDRNFGWLHELVAKNDVEMLTSKIASLRKTLSAAEISAVLNKKNAEDDTPLHVAVKSNKISSHIGVIEVLLKNGADPNARDRYETPLWYLTFNRTLCDLGIFKLFVQFKANFYVVHLMFMTNISRYSLDVVKFIVQNIPGFDVNQRIGSELAFLHRAATFNQNDSHYEVLEFLLENGADVNAKDYYGRTPLYYWIRAANWRIVELFLKYNADLHAVTKNGNSIIFALCGENSDVQVLNKLIYDFNSDVNHLNENKETPLHYVMDEISNKFMNIEVLKWFLKNGVDINTPDKNGVTPLVKTVERVCAVMGSGRFLENLNFFNFIIDQTDFNVVHTFTNLHSFDPFNPEFLWKWLLEHLAKLKFLNIPIHPNVLEFIGSHADQKNYFTKCSEELEVMSNTKPRNSWINFFNLLVDNRKKLKNYAGNKDMVKDFESNDWLKTFPIYGASMQKNVEKGIRRRELFDESSILLSDSLPIFNSTHLIVKDILDCVLSKKDLSLFCKCRFLP